MEGRREPLALVKREAQAGVCMEGFYACPPEFGGCCMNGRMCATKDCPPEPKMRGAMINLKDALSSANDYTFPFDLSSPPIPNGNGTGSTIVIDSQTRRYLNGWGIAGLVIMGIFSLFFFFVLFWLCCGASTLRRTRAPKATTTTAAKIAKQPAIPKSLIPKRTKTPSSSASKPGFLSGLFKFGKKGKKTERQGVHRAMSADDIAQHADEYGHINDSEKAGITDNFIEPSPPPTPAPAYGWSNTTTGARQSSADLLRNADTAYGGSTTDLRSTEKDSLVGHAASTGKTDVQDKRMSTNWDETYQTRPTFDPFDDDPSRRGLFDPDSRSGH